MNPIHRAAPTSRRSGARVVGGLLAIVLAPAGLVVAGPVHDDWATGEKIDEVAGNHPDVNTPALDGCPSQSPDGLSLYLASNRPGGHGGLDIWVTTRRHRDDPWGAPQNLPSPINSLSDDFCPTPLEADGLLFVSRRTIEGVTCGMGDIYVTRHNPAHGWTEPEHLGCDPVGPNSALDEQGPSVALGELYFSRSSGAVPGDLFRSRRHGNGYGPATPIAELNDGVANDIQPNVRKDGREMVFSSTRAGGFGGPDIWVSTRASAAAEWSAPVNAGPGVNTGLGESRPFLSADAAQLLFGRGGPIGTGEGGTGGSDIYVTTRTKNP